MNPGPSCKIINKVQEKDFDTNLEEQINKTQKKSLISTSEAQNVSFTEISLNNEDGCSIHFPVISDCTDANMCITAKPLGTNAKKIIRDSNKKNAVKPVNITSNMQKNITQYSKDDTIKENIRYIDEPGMILHSNDKSYVN
ncbi:uncharacterized protein LOC114946120 [Nylanderia fulva]|uniref:uncharacterized protein LOC114930162 n=1 Tax=Nylanderia fulva TaxID=613905 RepID=UPI0010FB07B6|nr:uncharacterized protein LOC114930162 [Nylanderia fulva]XP_029158736.1 uncharacterized protein LOC114931011 [Nylanderia fulva]XP_029167441.1 uncharacterized protein LOC114937940 [Nylanderia fulva]XP_029168793.1 uncharacterized protein LOC114938848 [Nylanderia fulva]XP_029177566.1 uncharacterized protein LOC114945481 [Nylanderia fulva]XP_029178388.1 uncharacterized protein LOC114946120 [Nylanderia fulva]